jgi:hypothetical protein
MSRSALVLAQLTFSKKLCPRTDSGFNFLILILYLKSAEHSVAVCNRFRVDPNPVAQVKCSTTAVRGITYAVFFCAATWERFLYMCNRQFSNRFL